MNQILEQAMKAKSAAERKLLLASIGLSKDEAAQEYEREKMLDARRCGEITLIDWFEWKSDKKGKYISVRIEDDKAMHSMLEKAFGGYGVQPLMQIKSVYKDVVFRPENFSKDLFHILARHIDDTAYADLGGGDRYRSEYSAYERIGKLYTDMAALAPQKFLDGDRG